MVLLRGMHSHHSRCSGEAATSPAPCTWPIAIDLFRVQHPVAPGTFFAPAPCRQGCGVIAKQTKGGQGHRTTETRRHGQHECYRARSAIRRDTVNDMHLSDAAIGDHLDSKITRREILKRGSAVAAAALAAPLLTTGRAAAATARSSSRSTVTITEWGFGTDN